MLGQRQDAGGVIKRAKMDVISSTFYPDIQTYAAFFPSNQNVYLLLLAILSINSTRLVGRRHVSRANVGMGPAAHPSDATR
mmetsp:Transcript_57830/g.132843  ORF Transcript_57830/g.132843 Transcript_57830/m.132843 type:complete len:81 (+) Transcript_57830:162-404(+)|eukprot:CAMPEP_0119374304 /NCGR_PEP_ID=MMETSP1334-20130426/30515_1 /TAXON_ID=127549 /ORGANISM="Calcidiscus leptoporus, Strain RCC1130" /LENGTH=80 /DNA_ID=CAMNT_0007392339 /DNA_START=251 /DNA_END=493 /DNA_ORIENTATION=+